MSLSNFKATLVRLMSWRTPREQAVLQEMVEQLFPLHRDQEVRRIHAEAYDVNGTTVIVSRLGAQRSNCVLVDYETGKLLCKEVD